MAYLNPEDSIIDREMTPGCAVLCDEEYTALKSFDDSMTDEQILSALRFANDLYSKGIEHGKEAKAAEIRAALGVAPAAI